MKFLYHLTAVMISLVFFLLIPSHAAAQQENHPVSVVILLEQTKQFEAADPGNIAKQSVELLLSLLPTKDTISIIGFDSEAKQLYGPGPAPENSVVLQPTKLARQSEKISDYVNLESALNAAYVELGFGEQEENHVILVTSGALNLPINESDNEVKHRIVTTVLDRFIMQNTVIHGITVGQDVDLNLIHPLFQETQGYAAQILDSSTPAEIGIDLFNEIHHPQFGFTKGGEFKIDSHVQHARLIVGIETNASLNLHTPDGTFITRENPTLRTSWTTAESYTIIDLKKPQSGEWFLQIPKKIPFWLLLDSQVELVIPSKRKAYLQDEPVYILAQLSDLKNKSEITGSRISARILDPFKSEKSKIDLLDNGSDNGDCLKGRIDRYKFGYHAGVFEQNTPLTPDRYQIEITATKDQIYRCQKYALNVENGYSVLPVTSQVILPENSPLNFSFIIHPRYQELISSVNNLIPSTRIENEALFKIRTITPSGKEQLFTPQLTRDKLLMVTISGEIISGLYQTILTPIFPKDSLICPVPMKTFLTQVSINEVTLLSYFKKLTSGEKVLLSSALIVLLLVLLWMRVAYQSVNKNSEEMGSKSIYTTDDQASDSANEQDDRGEELESENEEDEEFAVEMSEDEMNDLLSAISNTSKRPPAPPDPEMLAAVEELALSSDGNRDEATQQSPGAESQDEDPLETAPPKKQPNIEDLFYPDDD